jgi:hypothetical protein
MFGDGGTHRASKKTGPEIRAGFLWSQQQRP